jgi:hypothetical protein
MIKTAEQYKIILFHSMSKDIDVPNRKPMRWIATLQDSAGRVRQRRKVPFLTSVHPNSKKVTFLVPTKNLMRNMIKLLCLCIVCWPEKFLSEEVRIFRHGSAEEEESTGSEHSALVKAII